MKKYINILAAISILVPATSFASGYRIPEQSVNSTALSGAYIANTPGADASYYNPANMTDFADQWQVAADLTYIKLYQATYTDNLLVGRNGTSKEEKFLIPHLFVVSPKVNNFRFGLAMTHPAGLSKRWLDPFPRSGAEDFSLKVFELNPSIAWQSCDKFSVAAGIRLLQADGEVRSYVNVGGADFRRDLEGNTTEFGYNLAATYRPNEALRLSATYRSKVDLDLSGEAQLIGGPASYSGPANVSVPVPAVLSLATAYSFEQTTVELTYDRTYWDAYEKLDFNYSSTLAGFLTGFDTPVAKNWSNTNAYRIGITHQCTDQLTAMIGFAIDENPVPDSTLGFELPDSDAIIYSIGARYKINDNLEVGAAFLYDDKEDRSIPATAANSSAINGTVDGCDAHILSVGLQYNF